MAQRHAVVWGPPSPRCHVCGVFVPRRLVAGYGSGLLWCDGCALAAEALAHGGEAA